MLPSTLPRAHEALLNQILDTLKHDRRIIAIGASGSFATDKMDEFSDLDLSLVIEPSHYADVMKTRIDTLDRIPGLTAKFTGEHVGEPRVVIALFSPDAVHVDFKFVCLDDAGRRVDDVAVLWERDQRYRETLQTSPAHYPTPEAQWLEDRMWVWVHYAVTKIARGEYFESLEFLAFIRSNVLSPMALRQRGLTPSGVRRIESRLPAFSMRLRGTLAEPERGSLTSALRTCVELYDALIRNESVVRNEKARELSLQYLDSKLA